MPKKAIRFVKVNIYFRLPHRYRHARRRLKVILLLLKMNNSIHLPVPGEKKDWDRL